MSELEKLFNAIREELQLPEQVITLSTRASDVEGWDSMRHLQIIMRLEREFNMRFATKDILAVRNVGELYALVQAAQKK